MVEIRVLVMLPKKSCLTLIVSAMLMAGKLHGQCAGLDFSPSTAKGCVPLQVYFKVTGFQVGSQFSWGFGASFSNFNPADSNYQRFFTVSGQHDVQLKIKLLNGTICTVNKLKLVNTSAPATIRLHLPTPILCNLSDTATLVDSTQGVAKRDWVIEGVKYNSQTVNHRFNSIGPKSVSIVITDQNGCVATMNADSVVKIFQSFAPNFKAKSSNGCPSLLDTFNINIINPPQQITGYSWVMPGAIPSTGTDTMMPVRYDTAGDFAATLTVSTVNGCSYSLNKQAVVKVDTLPDLRFSVNKNLICNAQQAMFVNISKGQSAGAFSWTLVGGGTIKYVNTKADTLKVAYSTPGNYGVKLTYKNTNCTIDSTIVNLVQYGILNTNFFADARFFCQPGDSVKFMDSTIVSPVSTAVQRLWTIYENATPLYFDTASSFIWKYPHMGKYKVTMVAQSAAGCIDSIVKKDYITADTPRAAIMVSAPFICPNDSIFFTDRTPGYSSKSKLSRLWTIYGSDQATIIKTDTGIRSFIILTDTGYYHAKLITQNSQGCSDSAYDSVGVVVVIPNLDFSVDSPDVCSGNPTQLIQRTDPQIPRLKYSWTVNHHDSANIKLFDSGDTVQFPLKTVGQYDVKMYSLSKVCPDSLERTLFISVNGLASAAWVDTAVTCVPVVVRGHSAHEYNVHTGLADTSITYLWSSSPTSPIFSGADSGSTNITFVKSGCYTISLTTLNAAGCQTEVPLVYSACVGGIANFTFSTNTYCSGDTIRPFNKSKLNVGYKWELESGNAAAFHIFPNDTSTNPYFLIDDDGSYAVRLIAKTYYGCPDTVSQNVQSRKPTFSFSSPDTFSICGPTTVALLVNSSNTNKFEWDFGDGSAPLVTTQKTVYHIFKIDKGKNSFNINAIAFDQYGCTSSFKKNGYIRISGPAPYFCLSQHKGCDTVNVIFTDSSYNVSKFYFYNDDGSADSTLMPPHKYIVKNVADTFAVYRPLLIGFDSTHQCVKIFSPTDSILVALRPSIKMEYPDSTTCIDMPIKFSADSVSLRNFVWDYENNGSIDATSPSAHFASDKPGKYSVRLIAQNRFGCSNTITKFGLVTVKDKPHVAITIADSVFCYGDTIDFADGSIYSSPVISRHWDFGDTTLNDTSNQATASYYYGRPGFFDVWFKAMDIYKCSDSINSSNSIHIYNQFAPEKSNVLYVTNKNNDVEVVWNKNNSSHFKQYKLYRTDSNGTQNLLYTSANSADTAYLDAGMVKPTEQQYQYGISSDELCYKKNTSENFHPNILLHTNPVQPQHIRLSWNRYTGWDSVDKYLVLRSVNGSTFTQVAELQNKDTTWLNKNLCDSNYLYMVKAVRFDKRYTAETNQSTETSPYKKPDTAVRIKSISVTNDENIRVRWDTAGNYLYTNIYHVYRLGNPNPLWQHIGEVKDRSFIDIQAEVGKEKYLYQVVREDLCHNEAPASEASGNILLGASSSNDTTSLDWSLYKQWDSGVAKQVVEWYDQTEGKFVKTITITNGDTTWEGINIPDFDLENICYRIYALGKYGNNRDTSFSNLECVRFNAKIFIPNTFTPNGDLLNDEFKPTVSFIFTDPSQPALLYRMTILNQWGEKMFETNDKHQGWDGTFGGKPAPTGRYAYIIYAVAYKDKKKITEKGYFNLMR